MLQHNLKDVLNYEPLTGIWTWKKRLNRRIVLGKQAGTFNQYGYRVIKIFGKGYLSSRLAWFYMTGVWPEKEIDHINRDSTDDRWSNLRLVTRWQNNTNKSKRDLPLGVEFVGKTYRANCKFKGKQYRISGFTTAAEAHEAYLELAKKLHGSEPLKEDKINDPGT